MGTRPRAYGRAIVGTAPRGPFLDLESRARARRASARASASAMYCPPRHARRRILPDCVTAPDLPRLRGAVRRICPDCVPGARSSANSGGEKDAVAPNPARDAAPSSSPTFFGRRCAESPFLARRTGGLGAFAQEGVCPTGGLGAGRGSKRGTRRRVRPAAPSGGGLGAGRGSKRRTRRSGRERAGDSAHRPRQ